MPLPTVQEVERVDYSYDRFFMGADLSSINMSLAANALYRDSGKVVDPYLIFKKYGCNVSRFRLFHSPTSTGGYNSKGFSGLEDVGKAITKARLAGMKIFLDFHYSDTWADPGQQKLPSAWANIKAIETLRDSLYNYTYQVLSYLQSINGIPDMIQPGNEILPGMLFPFGKVDGNDFTNLRILLDAAIKAIRDFSKDEGVVIKIVIHPEKAENAEWWINGMENALALPFDYDLIGLSYYDNFTTISFDELKKKLVSIRDKFKKGVFITETAYQWTNESKNGVVYNIQKQFNGFPVTKQGQLSYMQTLTQLIMDAGGLGIIVWEPAWIASNQIGEYRAAFFDFQGNVLPAMNFMTYKYKF